MDEDLRRMVEDTIVNVYCEVKSKDVQDPVDVKKAQEYLKTLSERSDGSLFEEIIRTLNSMESEKNHGKRK